MNFIHQCYAKMIEENHQDVEVVTTEKWKILLIGFTKNLLSVNDRVPIWHVTRKIVKMLRRKR